MTTRKSGGWKQVVLYVAVAGSAVMVLMVVGIGATLFWASSTAADLGDPTPEPVERSVSASGLETRQRARPVKVGDTPPRPTRLVIELEDGSFDIEVGPAGSDVAVAGAYATNYYELVEEYEPGDDQNGPVMSIRFRATSSMLVRMMASLAATDSARQPNELTVTIPADVPISLSLDITRGESDIDLGGLHLTGLDAELTMGNHRLDFAEPLAQEIDLASVTGRYGNMELEHLGNSRAREFRTSSSMGNFSIDLAGAWVSDQAAQLSLEHSMGDLHINVPDTVRIADDSQRTARFADGGSLPTSENGDVAVPGSPIVRLDVSTTMGGTRVTRY